MTQQTTPKPLPCPFCGAENVTIAEGSTYRWAHAECAECGAAAGDIRRQNGQGTDNPEVQEAAIAEWNIRDRREIDALKAKVVDYAKDALCDTISDISETYWAVSWQEGIVAAIKKAVTDPEADRRVWGGVQLSEAEVTVLRRLSEDAGGWPDE